MKLTAETPVQFLKGVGPRRAEQFARMGVGTVEDLLYHVPHRYIDATTVTPIARATVGNEVTVVGTVVSKGVLPTRRLRIFRAILKDASGVIECAWPGQAFLDRTIHVGQRLLVTGQVKHYHGRQIVPKEQIILDEAAEAAEAAGAAEWQGGSGAAGGEEGVVLPVYPATEGLSHRMIRKVIRENLDAMLGTVEDVLPVDLRRAAGVVPLREAFERLHRPQGARGIWPSTRAAGCVSKTGASSRRPSRTRSPSRSPPGRSGRSVRSPTI